VLWQYIQQLGITAKDSIITEDAVMEILICLLGFFVPFAIRPKPLQKNEQSVRKILWWKLRSKGEWRASVILVLLIAFHCGIFSPYLVYVQNQNQITTNNLQISYLTNQLSILQDEVKFWQDGISGGYDSSDPKKFRAFGGHAFQIGHWRSAVTFYELAYSNAPPEWPQNYQQVYSEPYYFFAILKTNNLPAGGKSPERMQAYGIFESNLSAMTNRIHNSVFNKSPNDAYNTQRGLHWNIVGLETVRDWSEDQGFVSNIIVTVSTLQTNATLP
jgi:hypothetical protein